MIKIGKDISKFYVHSYQPTENEELKNIIKERISKEGSNCNLNDIDVSIIKDMSGLFCNSIFTGNISKWNVSNVENMAHMFDGSEFNQPIGDWDVSSVEDMSSMFDHSKFNQDISNWKIRKDCKTLLMFNDCPIKEEYKPVLPK